MNKIVTSLRSFISLQIRAKVAIYGHIFEVDRTISAVFYHTVSVVKLNVMIFRGLIYQYYLR